MQAHDTARPAASATGIPAELRDRPQWVAWRSEERDGKATKLPINPRTGRHASSTDPTTWADFQTAQAAVARYRCQGVGFVFTADDPYTGIDLDGAYEATGRLAPWAASIVRALDSYTEVSPSGRGLHLIIRGHVPEGGRRRGPVEMYDRDRYFTMTGDHLPGTALTIEERQAELDVLHAMVFGSRAATASPRPITAGSRNPLPDRVLLGRARAARNGRKFRQLYDRGEWEAAGYPSPSEADLALCTLLRFWTGEDPDRIDALFRHSALMRPKWDASSGSVTYGGRTIALVCGPVVVG